MPVKHYLRRLLPYRGIVRVQLKEPGGCSLLVAETICPSDIPKWTMEKIRFLAGRTKVHGVVAVTHNDCAGCDATDRMHRKHLVQACQFIVENGFPEVLGLFVGNCTARLVNDRYVEELFNTTGIVPISAAAE